MNYNEFVKVMARHIGLDAADVAAAIDDLNLINEVWLMIYMDSPYAKVFMENLSDGYYEKILKELGYRGVTVMAAKYALERDITDYWQDNSQVHWLCDIP